MAARRPTAVLHIRKPTNYREVMEKAQVIIDNMTENSNYYPDPDPPLSEIAAQIKILNELAISALNRDKVQVELRNEASKKLYRMLQKQIIYINKVGNGDSIILGFSGAYVYNEYAPRGVPSQVIIKKIENAHTENTAKITILTLGMSPLVYKVQMTDDNNDNPQWVTVLITTSSFKLLIPNMIRGKEVWFRVAAENSSGQGIWSQVHSFISR